jgi:hypothetical protein
MYLMQTRYIKLNKMTGEQLDNQQVTEHSTNEILDFFIAANAALVKKKLDKYGLVDEGISLDLGDFALRSPTLIGGTFGQRKLARHLTRNPFLSRLKAKSFWRKRN